MLESEIRQSGVSEDGKKGQIPVLPNQEPIQDWQAFWQAENNRLSEASTRQGDSLPETWSAYAPYGTAEKSFSGIVVPGKGTFSGRIRVSKSGSPDRPIYSAAIDTNSSVDEATRIEIAKQVLPDRFFTDA